MSGGAAAASAGAVGGVLGSILGRLKETNAARPKGSGPGDARPITKADVMTREEKLMEARRTFERTHTERMRRELVDNDGGGADAFVAFPPMEKTYRNILHELAADLGLHSESVEMEYPDEGGDKYVVVYKKPPAVELTDAEEARRAMAKARASGAAVKKGEALSDRAPVMPVGDAAGLPQEFTVVGTVKRDLRSVAEVSLEMRKRKRAEKDGKA